MAFRLPQGIDTQKVQRALGRERIWHRTCSNEVRAYLDNGFTNRLVGGKGPTLRFFQPFPPASEREARMDDPTPRP